MPQPGRDYIFHVVTLEPNATLLLGEERHAEDADSRARVWNFWGSGPPWKNSVARVGTRLSLFFFKVGHFQPLHNDRWEQVYESNVSDLKSLSLKVS